MKLEKAEKRDRNRKKRNQMVVSGAWVKVIQAIIIKKSIIAKRERQTDKTSRGSSNLPDRTALALLNRR